jgi:hypothetical protein
MCAPRARVVAREIFLIGTTSPRRAGNKEAIACARPVSLPKKNIPTAE